MQTVDGKARLAELAKPLLGRIPEGVYRELLLASLAEAVGLTAPRLEEMLASGDAAPGKADRRVALPGKQRSRATSARPSIVRRALTLLLNHPQAALTLDADGLAAVERPGVRLLRSLIETVQKEPNITTAGILERWRHDAEGRHLGKLAAVELPAEDDFDAAAELVACLDRLAATARRDRIDFLIEKQRVNSLTEDEKAELRQLN